MNNIHIYYLLVLSSALFLSACEDRSNRRELEHYTENVRKTVTQEFKKQTTMEFRLPAPVAYQSDTYSSESGIKSTKQVQEAAVNPLLAYPLKSFQFTGTISQDNQMTAYLLAPDNSIHQVKEGDIIGDNYGRISKIYSDHIEIIEKHKDLKNQVTDKIVVMQLKE